MISESLKQAARIPHAELEKSLVDRLRSTNTPQAYGELLRLFHKYYKPVESLIDNPLTFPAKLRRQRVSATLL